MDLNHIANSQEVPITVVIPTKNSERTLKNCIESIQKQSLRPLKHDQLSFSRESIVFETQ